MSGHLPGPEASPHDLRLAHGSLPTASRCVVAGVVNVTPDSFSDGGRYASTDAAVRHGVTLVAEGADVLDVGGESTRPGAEPVDAAVELSRVLPVVEGLRQMTGVPISVDTRKASVAEACLAAGAVMINDVSAGRDDPELLGVVARWDAAIVLMHMLGTPATMQQDPRYDDVVEEVAAFLSERCDAALAAGVRPEAIAVDPGIGFGKTDGHNLALLSAVGRLGRLGHPVMVGPSRKGFIGRTLGLPVDQRLEGTAATVAWAVERGARMVRVHDVGPILRTVRMTEALLRASTSARVAAG